MSRRPPLRVTIITIIDYILLPVSLFMGISLSVRLRKLNEGTKDSNVHVANAPWMHRAAMTAMTGGVLFFVGSLLMHGNPNTTPTLCKVVDVCWNLIYTSHKLGVYSFIWFRISTFSDFFSEDNWKRLRIFSGFLCGSYIIVMLSLTISYTFDTFSAAQFYCTVPTRLGRTSNTIFGALLILLDMTISGSGLIAFVRLLWCSPVLGKIASRDPQIGEAARNVVKWSIIALSSSPMSILLTIIINDHYGLIDIDVALNCFCIAMQYPNSLYTLIELILEFAGYNNVDNDTTRMVVENAEGGKVANNGPRNEDL